jgi:hypothetical protein
MYNKIIKKIKKEKISQIDYDKKNYRRLKTIFYFYTNKTYRKMRY